MNTVVLPEEFASLLLHLSLANLRSARTIDALRNLCPGERSIDEALVWLIDKGYVCTDDDTFELTFAGQQTAQQAQLQVQSERFAAPKRPLTADRRTPFALPIPDTQPMATQPEQAPAVDPPVLQYMLAFETPRNLLPIPLLDGDVIGRMSEANISLGHDEFISGQHCCFKIGHENQELTLAVEDLGSRNGTYVNEFRLHDGQSLRLEHGSRIRIGSTVLIVVKIPY